MNIRRVEMKGFFVVILLAGVIFSGVSIFLWYMDSVRLRKELDTINGIVELKEDDSNDVDSFVNPPLEEDNLYWKYIKTPLLEVDLSDLKKINSETMGWIQVLGTNINYPFVQHNDNEYYLNHSFKRKKNGAGWVFLDSRNNIEKLDKNTIIYAHGRIDSIMFGTLKNITKSSWYENKDNHIIRMSTEKHNTLWQVFSVYHIKTTSDYIVNNFNNDSSYDNFLKLIKERSIYKFDVDLNSNDNVLTLSTCYSKSERVVMHAKLIKQESNK
ncbi:MAG: class B sortase [Candidatus Dojkabacteria bacterium]|jgi:sortase B|nr:class B sortase [Candidatus Dojkabacteria bacterium]